MVPLESKLGIFQAPSAFTWFQRMYLTCSRARIYQDLLAEKKGILPVCSSYVASMFEHKCPYSRSYLPRIGDHRLISPTWCYQQSTSTILHFRSILWGCWTRLVGALSRIYSESCAFCWSQCPRAVMSVPRASMSFPRASMCVPRGVHGLSTVHLFFCQILEKEWCFNFSRIFTKILINFNTLTSYQHRSLFWSIQFRVCHYCHYRRLVVPSMV